MRAYLIAISLVLLGIACSITPVFAEGSGVNTRKVLEEPAQIIKPGILPDSFFYWTDKFGEELKFVFMIGKEKKADYLIQLAAERLAEQRALSEAGITKYADQLTTQYDGYIQMAEKMLAELREQSIIEAKELQLTTEKEIFTQERVVKKELAKAPAEYAKQRDSVINRIGAWFGGVLSHLKWKKGEIEKMEVQMSE